MLKTNLQSVRVLLTHHGRYNSREQNEMSAAYTASSFPIWERHSQFHNSGAVLPSVPASCLTNAQIAARLLLHTEGSSCVSDSLSYRREAPGGDVIGVPRCARGSCGLGLSPTITHPYFRISV